MRLGPIALLIFASAFCARAAEPTETTTAWLLGVSHRAKEKELEIADPFTLRRELIPLDAPIRAQEIVLPRGMPTMLRLSIEGKGPTRRVVKVEDYRPTTEELQPDSYRFVGMDALSPTKYKVKLTRFGRLFEPLVLTGPKTDWMITTARTFEPDQLVHAVLDLDDRAPVLLSLDNPRPVARGRFLSTADADLDGKRYPGLRLMVEGKIEEYVFPPAGGQARSDDPALLATAKKLKKNAFVRITLDAQRPRVIRSIEPDVTVMPERGNGMLFTSPGVRLRANFSDAGRVYLRVEPGPVTMADTYFELALHDRRRDEIGEAVELPGNTSREARLVIESFASTRVRDEVRAAEQQLRTVDISTDAAMRRVVVALEEACQKLSMSVADEVSTYYADARRVVGPELTAALEKKGAALHAAGMMR